MNGYRLNTVTMRSENTWRINVGADDEEILDVTTQHATMSTVTKNKSILPTVFGQEGDLFYKFLDSNMFSVISRMKDDPTQIAVRIINGVTGRIVHQFTAPHVSNIESHAIRQLFNEQFFVMTFTRSSPNTGLMWQELQVYELYSKKKEGNTWELITDYFKGHERITSERYSSFEDESEPIILKMSLMVPFSIKALSMTETANHITGHTLILSSTSDKIYALSQNFFSARRPLKGEIDEPLGWMATFQQDPEELLKKMEEEIPMETQLKSAKF